MHAGTFPKLPKIGMRNIKVSVTTALCALIYFLFDRSPAFACIGVIFGFGRDWEDSYKNGGNRLYGTVIGGLIGMAMFRIHICFYPDGQTNLMLAPLLFLGVVLLIMACRIFKWPGGIQPGGVVLCIILFNTPVATYVSYSLNRMFDTGVGFAVALIVNLLLPRERVERWMQKLHLKVVPVE